MARPLIGPPLNVRLPAEHHAHLVTFKNASVGVRDALSLAIAGEAEKVRELIEARATLLRVARAHLTEKMDPDLREMFIYAEHEAMLVVLEALAELVGVEL